SIAARWRTPVRPHSPVKAFLAAATAASTRFASASVTEAITVPSAGLMSGNSRAPATNRPSMKLCSSFILAPRFGRELSIAAGCKRETLTWASADERLTSTQYRAWIIDRISVLAESSLGRIGWNRLHVPKEEAVTGHTQQQEHGRPYESVLE